MAGRRAEAQVVEPGKPVAPALRTMEDGAAGSYQI
jgi:hypothetical protein